jgi:TRAP-type C4-dicarboxylate transport system permease small subunit
MAGNLETTLRRGTLWLLGAVVMTMMTMTALDVGGRYLFNSPLPGTQEMTELLLALLVFGAAPLVSADRKHITTDLMEGAIKGKVRRVRDLSVSLVSSGCCAVIAWRLAWQAADMAAMGGRTPLVGIPIGPVLYFSAAMCAGCAVITLVQALRIASRR